ncbi:hypothetical protein [Leifsonia sp. Leaf264]|uniref:hypothetical protein n=1 Tax=Leifsonia sp. Leaf264 TaxID=1736314 RepID=UPI0012F9B6D0|nr:hypothetical protein [Leifsonia sp. Leaf264]
MTFPPKLGAHAPANDNTDLCIRCGAINTDSLCAAPLTADERRILEDLGIER